MSTKELILATALRLFLRNGYSAVSVNDIIKAAGISKGGFYHHFRSKEELFEEGIDVYFAEYLRGVKTYIESEEGATRDKIERIFRYFFPLDDEMKDLLKEENVEEISVSLLILEGVNKFASMREKVKHAYREVMAEYADIIRAGMNRGELRPDLDPEYVALRIAALLEGLYVVWMFDPEVDIRSAHGKMLNDLWDSIKA